MRPRATLRDRMRGANKLERDYSIALDEMVRSGGVKTWAYESIRLRLADGTFYTPDFLVVTGDDVVQIHETKGFMREAARVRLKVAAELHPFEFFLIRREAGQWTMERV